MITLTAKISLLETAGQTLSAIQGNLQGNNISSEISAVLGQPKKAKNPFIIGASTISDGATLSNSVDYFIGSVPAENGVFASPYIITISGTNIDHFTIAFDTESNRHPTSITVDGKTYIDDDPIFSFINLKKQNSHRITITNWNTNKYPLVITGIYIGATIEIDYSVLSNLEVKHSDRANNDRPTYGIISNTGSVTFFDKNEEIQDFVSQKLFSADLKVDIYINDTISKKTMKVGKYEAIDWDYDNENREVTVQFKDNLEELQEINHSGIELARDNAGMIARGKTAKNLYEDLYAATPSKFGFKRFDALDDGTKSRLQATNIKYYYLESGNLWQQWTKLCELVQAKIWQDYDGTTIFKAV